MSAAWLLAAASLASAGGAPSLRDPLSWKVDGTSLSLNGGRWPMRETVRCEPEGTYTVSVALAVYSRKQGTMAWGHASLRTVRCVEGALRDAEYETYRLSAWNERLLREEHAGEAFLLGDYLRSQRGALVLFRNLDPVDRNWFGDAQAHNREIYELWLDRPPGELDRIALDIERWYDEQLATFRARGPLPERYRALTTNCTSAFQSLLGADDPPTLPFAWLRREQSEARMRVLHPSHALVRRWGGLPETVSRPRPILRWSDRLPDALRAELDGALADAPAAGPWLEADAPQGSPARASASP